MGRHDNFGNRHCNGGNMDNTCDLGGNLMTHESYNIENEEFNLERKLKLIDGLVLAVTAPSDEKAQEVLQFVNFLSNGMKKSDVEYCKEMAADRIMHGLPPRFKH